MKEYQKKGFIVLIVAIFSMLTHAQSPIGNWKRTSMILEDAQSKKSDVHKMMIQQMPCTENITYTFSANGKMIHKATDCAAAIKKSIEIAAQKSTSVLKGNTMYTSYEGDKTLNTKCTVTYSDNKMIMKYNYGPEDFNPTKSKSLTVVYQRI